MTPLPHPGARLVDAASGNVLAGPALRAAVEGAAAAYADAPPGLVVALMPTRTDAIVRYLGATATGRPIAPLDPAIPHLTDLVLRFSPAVVTGVPTTAPHAVAPNDEGATAEPNGATPPNGEGATAEPNGATPPGAAAPVGYRAAELGPLGPVWLRTDAHLDGPPPPPPHPDLALLLATSGSTGSPRLVRLARSAVLANAHGIATALGITGTDVAATTLPLHYTYGLSVLHSHLVSGATVVVTEGTVTQREFWREVARYGVTSLAAVPYQYEMLHRLRFNPGDHPRLRTLTQAGGRLRPELVADFHQRMTAVGGRMFVMYGQTEATARMTVLPSAALPEKLGSVGLAVPGGSVSVAEDGEIIYRGPNVMMGYAETARDLSRGDDLGGVLATGDLGHLDADGFLYIGGRKRRIAKIFGVRVNLDDVERMLTGHGTLAAVGADDRVRLWVEGADEPTREALRAEAARRLGTHSSGIEVRAVERLPLMANGKVDYRTLEGAT